MTTEQEALKHARDLGSEVLVVHSDEIGRVLWALACSEEPEYWVDAFKRKKEAVAYAKQHQLKIVGQHCEVSFSRGCRLHKRGLG